MTAEQAWPSAKRFISVSSDKLLGHHSIAHTSCSWGRKYNVKMPDEAVLTFLHWRKKKTGRLNEHELLFSFHFLLLEVHLFGFFFPPFFWHATYFHLRGWARCCHSWKVLGYSYKLIKIHSRSIKCWQISFKTAVAPHCKCIIKPLSHKLCFVNVLEQPHH